MTPKDETPADPLVGVLLADRYRITSVIARGAMGTVYLGEQHPLNRPVAVKVLHSVGEGDDPEVFLERFQREASTLARLQHPNTVRVYDFGTWGGLTYLVMEYVDGFSLRRLQAAGPIPPSRAINIALQICSALQEAHALGLIHRDLKPANVLITRHAGALDVVKVVDFGLAKGFFGSEHELTAAGQVLGTPMYMSPEQIRDEPCDPRSDIYSLGVLLYRSLTGKTPFAKGSTATMLMANLYDAPKTFHEVAPEVDVPPSLEFVVLRCLEKLPADRFANVLELRKALGACQIALDEPAYRWIELAVEDGHTVLPDEITEGTHSASLRVVSGSFERQRGRPPERPRISPTPTTAPTSPRGRAPVPDWLMAAAFALMVLTGLIAGVLADRMLRRGSPPLQVDVSSPPMERVDGPEAPTSP
jgi:serine/threonine protein kinase